MIHNFERERKRERGGFVTLSDERLYVLNKIGMYVICRRNLSSENENIDNKIILEKNYILRS